MSSKSLPAKRSLQPRLAFPGPKSASIDLQLLIDSTPALIHSGLPDGYLDFFNQGWLDYAGLSLEGLSGWRWTAVIHAEDVGAFVEKWREALATGEPFEQEARVRRADGQYRWMLHRKAPLRDRQGNIIRWYGSSIDIEDRKRTEYDLRQSEALLEEVQRLARIGTWVVKLPDISEYWSPSSFEIFGIDPAKGPPKNVMEFVSLVHPDDRERLLQVIEKEVFDQGRAFGYTFRIIRANGETRVIRQVGAPVYQNRVLTRYIGAWMDITEQEQRIEELRRSQYYLSEGQRLAHMGSWAFDASGFFGHWSRELFQIYGLDPAKGPPTLEQYLGAVHPQDREFMRKLIERMLGQGLGCDVMKRIVRPDGEIRYVRCVGVPVLDNGTLKKIVGTAMDVTEHEDLIQKLQQREAYLAEAQRLSHTGSFGWMVSTGEIFWSEETFRIFELDRATRPTADLVMQRVHPEDKELVKQTKEKASKDGKDFDLEHRLLFPDGSVKYLHVVAHALSHESGDLEFAGAVRDITAAKKAEDRLRNALDEIKKLSDRLSQENIALREEIDTASMFEEIVGASPPLKAVLERVTKVAPTDSTVFITGETGTGKELIARAIHKRSERSQQPFVSVSCAAIPASLIASELFGHEKGAFTGALQQRLGRFELAEGGTIFLDEIGELSAEVQISLLRVMQEREFERVGGNRAIRVDVRVIAATNRDLNAAIEAGSFRKDLFYRLSVFPIEMPPLRERKEDLTMLVEYFIDRYASKVGKKIRGIDKKTLDLFQSYHWPGNIRELQNVIERSIILCDRDIFSVDESWIVRESHNAPPSSRLLSAELVTHQKEIIEAALAESKGRVSGPSGAAAKLGIQPTTLESKIRSLKIDKHRFKAA